MFNRRMKYALLSGAALFGVHLRRFGPADHRAGLGDADAGPLPEVLAKYTPVTAERLKNPEDNNWLLFRRTYDGWGYSPLSQITPANVGNLQLVWSFATGQVEGHQAPPIVNNGVMFVATPGNQVLAIEAKTGALLWRYKRAVPEDMTNLHPTSRGVGLLGDRLYFASADAQLVALDVKTGKEIWVSKVADYRQGYYMSLMPLVADGKVMLGTSGGELGVRGFVAAYDADTGKEAWRTYMVPSPGQPGSETWPQGEQWKTGGGSIWVPATRTQIDPPLVFDCSPCGQVRCWAGRATAPCRCARLPCRRRRRRQRRSRARRARRRRCRASPRRRRRAAYRHVVAVAIVGDLGDP